MEISEEKVKPYRARPKGHGNARLVYLSYMRGAKRRNKDWDIAEQDFINMTQAACYYCGIPPSNKHSTKGMNGEFVYNGIDRVDNSKGYSINNCVPCCKMCNRAKVTYSESEFLNWAHRVASHSVSRIANY